MSRVRGIADRHEVVGGGTSRHAGQCEFASESDPAVPKILLKVRPGLGPGYSCAECGSCAAGWQVPHYAESVGRRRTRRAARAPGAPNNRSTPGRNGSDCSPVEGPC
jgi:hypothetical protein